MRAAGAGVSPAAARLQALKRSRQRKNVAEPVRTQDFQEKQAFLEKQARSSNNVELMREGRESPC